MKKVNDPDINLTVPIKVTKTYTEDEIKDMQGQMMERSLDDNEPDIELSGDIEGFFEWTISGRDFKKIVEINDKLLDRLAHRKRK